MAGNLSELVRRNAETSPGALAFIDASTDEQLTWSVAEERVSRLASGFRALGVTPGQRVVLSMRNRVEFALVYLAALRARLVVAPANPRGTTSELVGTIVDAGASLVVADETTLAYVRGAVSGIADALRTASEDEGQRSSAPRIVVVGTAAGPDEIGYDAVLATEPAFFPAASDAESLAVLLSTSGASDVPRSAMLTHRALLANIEQIQALDPPPVGDHDVVLGLLPLSHVYGLNAVLGVCVGQVATLLIADRFDVEGTLDLIAHHGVTVVPVAPPALAYWRSVDDLSRRLSSVRTVLSGSAPVDPDVVAEFETRTGLAVLQGYGLTEAAPVVTITGPGSKPGSVGRPLPGVEVRVDLVDPEEGDPGEILVKGANLFSGYWPDGSDGPDEDGWYRTGDIGYLDDGELFLVDRVKELILVSGFNVYPREVEEVIRELPYISDVAVVGEPDSATGEAVVAYVRRAPDIALREADVVESVLAHCRARLAAFKRPKSVVVAEELPRTVTGTVAKGRLRESRRRAGWGLIE